MAQLQSTGVTGSLVVTGTITAQQFHTEFVSSSILHESGSTSFGNSSDDVHNMTGSFIVNRDPGASQGNVMIIENTGDYGSSQDLIIKNQYDRDIGIKFQTLGGTNYIWQDSNGDDALIFTAAGTTRGTDATLILQQDHNVTIPNGDLTVNGGDISINKAAGAASLTFFRDANLTTNTLIGQLLFEADYQDSPIDYARIDIKSNSSSVRADMDFVVKSTSGNLETALKLQGGASTPKAFFYNEVSASAFIGDGSGLTNVSGTDSTKLPLAGGTMTGDIDMDNNDVLDARSVRFTNQEGSTFGTATGTLMFDENFYGDTEYGSTSIWNGNGGGLAIYNEDGWGRIITDANMQWLNAKFNSSTIETNPTDHSERTWYSVTDSHNIVRVTDGKEVYIEKESGTAGYGFFAFSPEEVGENFDISFRLSGGTPTSSFRHLAIAIGGDGTNTIANYDYLVFRHNVDNTALNQIRIDVAGTTEQSLVNASVPNFFDGTERHVLIQVRNSDYIIEVDGVVEHDFNASARTSTRGQVGFAIYEGADANTHITVRDFNITQYSNDNTILPTNVGIGLRSPLYPLDVNGNIGIRGGQIHTNSSTDSYKFLSSTAAKAGRFRGIQVSTSYSGTIPDDGILFSTDTNLYRSAANTLKTDDSFNVGGTFSVSTGNSSTTITSWSNTDTDIDGLLPGSAFGSLIKGATNGHIVIGLQENDANDTFSILSGGGNYMSDTTYDTLAFQVKPSGDTVVGGTLTIGGNLTGITDLYVADQIIHTGDTDTYMQFNAANSWRVVAGGTDRLSVGGDVNINNATDIQINGTSRRINFNAGSGTVRTTTANALYLATNSTNAITIDSSQNVGIGTTSPQKAFEVIGTDNNFVSVGVEQLSVGQWTGIHFGYRENNTSYRKSAIVFERTDLTSADAQGKIHILNGPQGSSSSATLSDAKITIAENGNVGIGETSPTAKLEVYGSGSTVLDIQGSQGQLFSITDDLTGDLLVASDISGIPIFTVNAADGVTVDGDTVLSGSLTVTGSDNSQLTVLGNASFGLPGNGSNTLGRYISIEGNADASGEGSGRIFFTEHNSTTTSMSNYGMSIGYRGGGTSIVGADGNTWTGLSAIGNGQWGMWGHDNDATGALIMYGDRAATYVDFASNNIQGITDIYVADQILHTGDTNTYMQFHAADQWRVVTGGTERLEVNNSAVTTQGRLNVGEHVIATGNVYSGGNEGFVFGSSTSEGEYIDRSGNDIYFVAGGAERMRIDGDGNGLGIGTTSPQQKLTIQAPVNSQYSGGNSSNGTSISNHLSLIGTATGRNLVEGPTIAFIAPANTDGSNLWALARILGGPGDTGNGSARGALHLQVRDAYDPLSDGTSWNWRTGLSIINNGYVGILDTAPSYPLDVNGNARISSTLRVGSYIYHDGDTNTYIRFVGGDDMQLVAGGRQMIRMDEGTDPDKLRFVTDDNWTDSNGDWNMSGRVAAGDQVSVNNRTAISVAHWAASGNTTGAIKIQIPGTHGGNYSMLVLRITAYEYNSTAATIYYVSGHDWTSGWYNNGVTKIGNGDKDVSLGYDSNYDYVIVGGTSSSWAYGHVTVDVMAHPSFYTTNMDITSGWSISQVTSLSGITTQSVTNKRVLTTSDEGSGNGIDADTVDGLQASSFIRSNADDNVTGHTEWQDGNNIRLGSGADFRMWHDGTDTYFRNFNHAGGNMYWTGENTAGTNQALIYMITNTAATYVRMFANGAERFRTIDGGSRVYGRLELDDSNTKLLKGSGNVLNITTDSGNVEIGPMNTSYCHIQTDRARFYFNKEVQVDGGVLRSHNEDLQLGRAGTADKIQIRDTSIGFFLDSAEDMRLENDGDLHVESDVIAYSTTVSDSRLKDDVITIGGALDKVKRLRGVEYTWNKGGRKDQRDLGLIAQEVEKVIPEIVREKKMPLMDDSDTKYKTVDYEKLTAVLIEGMKEQQAQIEDLKARISELENK